MTITVVNDYYVAAGKAAAADLVEYFKDEVPEVELSLWLEAQENPLHHYHITVFSNAAAAQALRDSKAIKRFTDRLYPHIDHATFIAPACDVWLAAGRGVKPVSL